MVVNADAPGLSAALPGLRRLLGPLLRTPEEGADAILWPATDGPGRDPTATAGPGHAHPGDGLRRDRRPRREHFLSGPRRSPDERDRDGDRRWAGSADRTGLGLGRSGAGDRR